MIQQTKTDRERFVALSRICLNNWIISGRKTLSFSEEINFLPPGTPAAENRL